MKRLLCFVCIPSMMMCTKVEVGLEQACASRGGTPTISSGGTRACWFPVQETGFACPPGYEKHDYFANPDGVFEEFSELPKKPEPRIVICTPASMSRQELTEIYERMASGSKGGGEDPDPRKDDTKDPPQPKGDSDAGDPDESGDPFEGGDPGDFDKPGDASTGDGDALTLPGDGDSAPGETVEFNPEGLPPPTMDLDGILDRRLAVGLDHACRIGNDNSVSCWGDNTYGQLLAPPGAFVQIDAGYMHTCGLRPSGQIACWGDNAYGQSAPQPDVFVQLTTGSTHSCGLTHDDVLKCWGNNSHGQAVTQSGFFTHIDGAWARTCAVGADHAIYCWGDPFTTYGGGSCLSNYRLMCDLVTIPAGAYVQVSIMAHGIARTQTGGLVMWAGYMKEQPTPGVVVDWIKGSGVGNCGILPDKSLICWGDSAGTGALLNAPTGNDFTQLDGLYADYCAMHIDGTVECFGPTTTCRLCGITPPSP